VRAWLQSRGWGWLTPARLKRATVAVFVAATVVSTVGLSGSTRSVPGDRDHPAAQVGHR
jgi:hypothetical protein